MLQNPISADRQDHANLQDSDLSEEYLARKFGTIRQPEDIAYEATADRGLVFQHALLQQQLSGETGTIAADFDKRGGELIVARIGNHCIGGARLTISSPRNTLPLEKSGLDLAEALPHLPLADVAYAEISDLAILADYQDSAVMLELLRQVLKRAADKNVRYIFTFAPLSLARLYRKASLFDLKWEILTHVKLPEQEDTRMMLSLFDLSPAHTRRAIRTTASSDVTLQLAT